MDAFKPKLFCRKPFEKIEVSVGGNCFLCCPSWLPKSIGSLKEKSFEEVWNGPAAREIRASILDGSFRYCIKERCGALQKQADPVFPSEEVTQLNLLEIIDEKITFINEGPSEIILSYDRTCNLSCPTCRTGVVSMTKEEGNAADLFRDKITPFFRFADRLKVMGSGDPFASPHSFRLLENLRSDDLPNLGVALHTNALLFTSVRWEQLKNIRPAIHLVEISIDAATPETYQLNRRGGEFSRLLDNLGFISSLRQAGEIKKLMLDFVVQQNNWREMEKFIELARAYKADKVMFSRLVDWGTFGAEELKARSIHETGHPEHALFLAELGKEIFDDPIVDLTNLEALRRGSPSL